MAGALLFALARGVQLSELLSVDAGGQVSTWNALLFGITMALVGFYFALSPGPSARWYLEHGRPHSASLRGCGWLIAIGCTLLVIRVLAVLLGWLST